MEFTTWRFRKKFVLNRTNCSDENECDIVSNMFSKWEFSLFEISLRNSFFIKDGPYKKENGPFHKYFIYLRYKQYKSKITFYKKRVNSIRFKEFRLGIELFPFKLINKPKF